MSFHLNRVCGVCNSLKEAEDDFDDLKFETSNCGLYVTNRPTDQSMALCLHCIGTRLVLVAATKILRLPEEFILVSVLECVSQKLRQVPQ